MGPKFCHATMNSLAMSAPTPNAIASMSHSKPVRVLTDELSHDTEHDGRGDQGESHTTDCEGDAKLHLVRPPFRDVTGRPDTIVSDPIGVG